MKEKLNHKQIKGNFDNKIKETLPGAVAEVLPIIREAVAGENNNWYPDLQSNYSQSLTATEVSRRFSGQPKVSPYLIEALLQSGIIEQTHSDLKFRIRGKSNDIYYRFNNKRIKEVLGLK